MRALFGQSVFSVANHIYGWEDVVLAAKLWGAWPAVEARTRRGLACLALRRNSGERRDERAVRRAAEEFRYERDLISGDETKAWLERWGLTVDEWLEYVEGGLLRDALSAETAAAVDRVAIEPARVFGRVACEAVCSGDLVRFARTLAGRVAVADRAAAEAPDEEEDAAPVAHASDFASEQWPGLSDTELVEKADHIALVERRYAAFLPRLVTPKAVAERIRTNFLDWTRFDCEVAAFPTEGMAREAALGVRGDGRALAEVVAEVGRRVERRDAYVDGVDPSVKNAMLAAAPGDVVGPVRLDDGYYLLQVVARIVPSGDDVETAERAERASVEAALAREINDRVRWHWRP